MNRYWIPQKCQIIYYSFKYWRNRSTRIVLKFCFVLSVNRNRSPTNYWTIDPKNGRSVHTLSVCSLGSKLRRLPFVIALKSRALSCRRSFVSLASLSNISLVASWSDLHLERAPVRLVVLVLTTAAAKLTVSSETCILVGVGERLSEPHEPQELVSLNSLVGLLPIRGEWLLPLRPSICAWMWSQMRLNRRNGPEVK